MEIERNYETLKDYVDIRFMSAPQTGMDLKFYPKTSYNQVVAKEVIIYRSHIK